MTLRDSTDPATWWPHVDEATRALAAGGLVVIPTDTVYGIAADAFQPAAVQALLDAKGRGRQMPPPVLIGDVRTLDGLADDVSDAVREMVATHWPGPLTVIVTAQPSLQWDLGETRGTVALRMPDHELALAVLRRTGPLAVSSANTTGSPAATTAQAASDMLGSSVRVYLDGGTSPGGVASTIVDATGPTLRIVREGALSAADLGIPTAELASGTTETPEAGAPADDATTEAPEAGAPADEGTAGTSETAAPAADGPTGPADAGDDVTIAPRRVRSRPAAASATGDDAPSEPSPEPRRTRKPKPATGAETTAEGDGVEPAAKPRRTRKPKAAEPATTTGAEPTPAGDAVEQSAKPRRARKPATEALGAESTPEGDAVEPAAKPRRTRKPRTAETTGAAETDAGASSESEHRPEAPAP